MATSNYQQLRVWQNGRELARRVYELTKAFPREEAFGLSSQMQRAAAFADHRITCTKSEDGQ